MGAARCAVGGSVGGSVGRRGVDGCATWRCRRAQAGRTDRTRAGGRGCAWKDGTAGLASTDCRVLRPRCSPTPSPTWHSGRALGPNSAKTARCPNSLALAAFMLQASEHHNHHHLLLQPLHTHRSHCPHRDLVVCCHRLRSTPVCSRRLRNINMPVRRALSPPTRASYWEQCGSAAS